MTTSHDSTLHGRLSHGHSRLTWLLDDLDAHVMGLQSDTDAGALILEELTEFARRLTIELREHIEEEERDIFTQVRIEDNSVQAELEELEEEHRELQVYLDQMWEAINATHADHTPQAVQRLADAVKTLRQGMQSHSSHERSFLSEVDARTRLEAEVRP